MTTFILPNGLPQWATQRRLEMLNTLSEETGGEGCVFGHRSCPPDHFSEETRTAWLKAMYFGGPMDMPEECELGHFVCPPHHYYPHHAAELVADWKADDARRRAAEWQAERERMHWIPDARGWNNFRHDRFGNTYQDDPLSREQRQEAQPLYYFVRYTWDALRNQRNALIRLPRTNVQIAVIVTPLFAHLEKGKRRKMLRRGLVPLDITDSVNLLCREAALDWYELHHMDTTLVSTPHLVR